MKRICICLLTFIVSAFIPIYFFFLWEPLKSSEVMSESLVEEEVLNKEIKTYRMEKVNLTEGIFNNIEGLNSDKVEKLNSLINELSIIDLIKVNEYFLNLSNKEEIEKGLLFLNKRMNEEKYEELREIISNYISLE